MNYDKNSKKSDPTFTRIDKKSNVFTHNEWKEKRRELLDEKYRVEEQSLKSTKETLSLIEESERIGLKTGNELLRQKETLNRVEDKLVTINGHLDESEKNLNSMKSFFNSLKNRFSKKSNQNQIRSDKNDLIETKTEFQYNSVLEENMCRSRDNQINNDLVDNNSLKLDENYENETINYWHKSNEINDKIEENLHNIDLGIETLKQLSLNLGQEIDSQNSLIDKITKDTERAELRIQRQNNQMKELLRK